MSEFAEYTDELRSFGEVMQEVRERTAVLIASFGKDLGIVYQEQDQPKEHKTVPEHVCGTVCTRCGKGSPQWRPRRNRSIR